MNELGNQIAHLVTRMAVVLTSLVAQDAYAISRWPEAKMQLGISTTGLLRRKVVTSPQTAIDVTHPNRGIVDLSLSDFICSSPCA